MLQLTSDRQIQDMQVNKINYFLQIFPVYGPVEEGGEDVWRINPLVANPEQSIDISFGVRTFTWISNADGVELQTSPTDAAYQFTGSAVPQLLPALAGGLPCYFIDIDLDADILVAKGQCIGVVDDSLSPGITATEMIQISFLGQPVV